MPENEESRPPAPESGPRTTRPATGNGQGQIDGTAVAGLSWLPVCRVDTHDVFDPEHKGCLCHGCIEVHNAARRGDQRPPLAAAPPAPAAGAMFVPPVDLGPDAGDLTDAVMAQRVHDELLVGRYCWAVGYGWMRWDATVWTPCPDETLVEEVRLWAVANIKAQLDNPYVAGQREVRQRLLGLLDRYRLIGLALLARGLCQVGQNVFDADPDLLNTPAGIVDLTNGKVGPHDPGRYMTRITAVGYEHGAEHPDWAAALAAVEPDVAEWLQLRFGQSITGHMTPDDLLLLLRGGGANGKSTILNAVKSALGGYGVIVSDKVLLADPKAHSTEMTVLLGARFALAEELPDEGHLNVKRLKDVIGTPEMTARRMRQDSIEWSATHSMFVSTNYLPKVTDTDHGTWRRLALVEFPFKFVKPGEGTGAENEREGDPGLRDRLKSGQAQREAVLAWLVEGARRWYDAGKAMPELPAAVAGATQRWRENSDLVLRFWADRLRPSAEHYITGTDMLDEFNAWAAEQGHKPRSAQWLTAQFAEHEATKRHRVVYRNVRTKATDVRSRRPTALLPPQGPFVPLEAPPGTRVRAWWGVRFASQQDE